MPLPLFSREAITIFRALSFHGALTGGASRGRTTMQGGASPFALSPAILTAMSRLRDLIYYEMPLSLRLQAKLREAVYARYYAAFYSRLRWR